MLPLPWRSGAPAVTVVFEASQEIRTSIVFATLVIGLVFVPVFFLEGVEGRLLAPLGFCVHRVAARIAGRRADGHTRAVPDALARVSGRSPHHDPGRHPDPADDVRAGARARRCRGGRPISAACLALLGGSVVALGMSGRAFLPEFNEGALTISVVTIPGTSLEQSNALGTWVEEISAGAARGGVHDPADGSRRAR